MNPFLLGLFICVRRRFGLTMDTNFLPVSIIEFLGTYEKAQCSKNCLVITLQKLEDYDCRNTNHFLSILITPFRKNVSYLMKWPSEMLHLFQIHKNVWKRSISLGYFIK